MVKKCSGMCYVRTTRTLLTGLEFNLFNSKQRNNAVNTLLSRLKKNRLDQGQEQRFFVHLMNHGTERQKKLLSEQVKEKYGPEMRDKAQ